MSPEQAKGRTVDRRTDIFAFGCVVYEMLTGRPAFEGEDITEILAHVLTREPDWNALPPRLPARLTELLRMCLQKDVRKRRRDAGDLLIDIDQISTEEPQPLIESKRNVGPAWITTAVFAVAAVVLLVLLLRPGPIRPELHLSIVTPPTTWPSAFS